MVTSSKAVCLTVNKAYNAAGVTEGISNLKIMKFTYKLFPDWLRNITMHVQDPRIAKKCLYSMEQIFCCGLMVFLLRHRSLRSFCLENKDNPLTVKNLNRWITIKDIPSDDELRYVLQTASTKSLNDLLREFHQKLERKKKSYFTKNYLIVMS
jgi:hypothetical protein